MQVSQPLSVDQQVQHIVALTADFFWYETLVLTGYSVLDGLSALVCGGAKGSSDSNGSVAPVGKEKLSLRSSSSSNKSSKDSSTPEKDLGGIGFKDSSYLKTGSSSSLKFSHFTKTLVGSAYHEMKTDLGREL
ncbi:hypothetical protein WICPIJ_000319 [Wickerhamomyces pijperi]|uniref:Uncharacterized protein n=1 Tax=Wickerhamomyces pijperi TaxID=599730 RepID=A0A9P8QHF2_WICPI|nr:hypothetical protein WICPIJ_000319 [Wickerhamomyces pijperi]